MMRFKIIPAFLLLTLLLIISARVNAQTVAYFKKAAGQEVLAAKELQRYLYLRTGKMPILIQLHNNSPLPANSILVASLGNISNTAAAKKASLPAALGEQEYCLKSTISNQLLIIGGSRVAALYGAYKFLESTGIGFALDGDIIPDEQLSAIRISGFNKTYKPAFDLRGIQPFHDFPEGPDWWNADDYKAIITQLPKLGMNFIGFHNYPEKVIKNVIKSFAEPLVWIGTKDQFNADGTVKSAHPVSHANTRDSNFWGRSPEKTSDFLFGSSQLFEDDYFGADYMKNISPWPHTTPENISLFNKTGQVLNTSFTLARRLGVKTCIGTETPLTIPVELKEYLQSEGKDPETMRQDIYEAMFSRIKATHPLDYYWLWTPEEWKRGKQKDEDVENTRKDMLTAIAAAKNVNAPFTLATCGWALGPSRDRAEFDKFLPKNMPMSVINRNVGNEPVEPGFNNIQGRPKWQISWLEDDGAMVSPQLWVGRVRKDAADAYKYGCTGLMGIHWRTKILAPAFMALARAGWEANLYNKPLAANMRDYPVGNIYLDWAKVEFGTKAAEKAAAIFTGLDGYKTGQNNSDARFFRTSHWINGPGAISTNPKPWAGVEKEFAFIADFEQLKPLISGAGNMERYQYWLNTFYYAKAQGHINCLLGEIEQKAKQLEAGPGSEQKKQLANSIILLRNQAAEEWDKMETSLLQTVSTTGEMGTIANMEQHNMDSLKLLNKNDNLISAALGKPAPALNLSWTYKGSPRIIATTKRTLLNKGEDLDMKIRVLSADELQSTSVYWKPLGAKAFRKQPLMHINRGVYNVYLPATAFADKDFEYYVEVQSKSAKLRYPAGHADQTVVVW